MHSNYETLVNTIIKVSKELTTHAHMLESIAQKIEELRAQLINLELINSDTKEFCKTRDEFYRKVHEKFSILNKAKVLTSFNIRIDLNKIERDCLKSLERKIIEIFSVVDKFLKKFCEDSRLTRQDYDSFNLHYTNLISFTQETKVTHCEITEKLKNLKK
jgi:hypothetical protein